MKYILLILFCLAYQKEPSIELAYLYGYRQNDYNVIRWSTWSEKDIRFYHLSRKEGEKYTIIAQIHGGGTSDAISYYQFKDQHAPATYKLESISTTDTSMVGELEIQPIPLK